MNGKFIGIEVDSMFHTIPNNLVWDNEGKGNVLFEPTDEGQFDFLIYITAIYNCNPVGMFYTNISKIARLIGYKPRSGKGNINDRIKQSLDRLRDNHSILYEIEDGLWSIQVLLKENEKYFFKLHYCTIEKILGLNYINREDSELLGVTKYENKSKALYVYCYILARMNNINIDGYKDNINCCYPTMEEIMKDCNIGNKNYLIKLLRYFELDRILFTTNIGQLKNNNLINNASNYYTTNLNDIYGISYYSKGYYFNKGYDLNEEAFKKGLAKEIQELAYEGAMKLYTKDKSNKYAPQLFKLYTDRINAEFTILLQECNLSLEEYKEWENNNGQFTSKYRTILNIKPILFMFNNWKIKTEFLYHVKNCIEAIAMMYGVKN